MREILYAAHLCKRVYDENPNFDGLDIDAIIDLRDKHSSTEGQVFVNHKNKKLYMVFRGTEGLKHRGRGSWWQRAKPSLQDWLSNVKAGKTYYYRIRVHKGYAEAVYPIIKQVLPLVDEYGDYAIDLYGHSKGGAEATLITIALVEHFRGLNLWRVLRLITFGQPKVSTAAELKEAINCIYLRVQNGSDLVPRNPHFGYSHGGINLYLPNNKKLGYCLWNPDRGKKIRDRLFTYFERVQDHSIDDYIKEIEQCVEH
ncbi:MAG: lipase family protein [Pseudomonadales bacterium]